MELKGAMQKLKMGLRQSSLETCWRKLRERLMEKAKEPDVSWALRHQSILRNTRLRASTFHKSGHLEVLPWQPHDHVFL